MINAYNQTPHEYPTENGYNDKKTGRIIGWISGGVASAVACDLALKQYGDCVDLVFCNTNQEHPETFRFMYDLERFWGRDIKVICSKRFKNPQEVQDKYIGLNFANGAPCTTYLKREVNTQYQELESDFGQVFGYDDCEKEHNRAYKMIEHHPELNPIFPLITERYDRFKIFAHLKTMGITPPSVYKSFQNNNCIGHPDSEIGGCIQGGIGYWQQMRDVYPKKYNWNGGREHHLTRRKIEANILKAKNKPDRYRFYKCENTLIGWVEEIYNTSQCGWKIREMQPITSCKSQSKKNKNRLFLTECSDFPNVQTIDIIKGKRPVIMLECDGFCGTQLSLPE